MKNKIKFFAVLLSFLISTSHAFAAGNLIYSNEVREENANKMILDNDDTGGDTTIQFGQTLGKSLLWDADGGDGSGVFQFTDDVRVSGDFEATGTVRAAADNANGFVELVGGVAGDAFNLTINNAGLTQSVTVQGADLEKLVDIASSAADLDDAVSKKHLKEQDTKTNSPTFRINSDDANNFIDIVGNEGGTFNLTITNAGMTTNVTVTGADLEKLVGISSSAAEIDDAVSKKHVRNTDTGTSENSFTINSDGDDAAVEFGQTGNGTINFSNAGGNFQFDNNRLSDVADPVNLQDATTKNYVDNLVNGLSWQDPIQHQNQLVDGSTGVGGVRSGGKIYVLDEDAVLENDTITVEYDSTGGGTQSFVLTAKDTPTASSCEFESGATATDNVDMAASILNAINSCGDTTDFAGQSSVVVNATATNSVFLVHDTPSSTAGDGTITLSGSGFLKIDISGGKGFDNIVPAETHVCRADEVTHTWDGDNNIWVPITGGNSIPDATTSVKGKVELAEDGEAIGGVVVQGNDERLHLKEQDTKTNSPTFRINSDDANNFIDIVGNEGGTFNLTITNNGISEDITVNGSDLEKLVDIASSAADLDDAVSKKHDQNTDTGTDNASFRIDSDATNGFINIVGNAAGDAFNLTINNAGLTQSITVQGSDLEKLVDIASSAADLDDAVSKKHEKNTDTGTDSTSFTLDSLDAGGEVSLVFGNSVGEYLKHDGSMFHLSDDTRMAEGSKLEFRDNTIFINSSTDGQLDLDADTKIEMTTPNVDISGNLNLNGSLKFPTGKAVSTILDEDNMVSDSDSALATQQSIKAFVNAAHLQKRSEKIVVKLGAATIAEGVSGNHLCDVYMDSETGVANPHEFYTVKSTQSSLQDLDLKFKVRIPENFLNFSDIENDIHLWFKNTGINLADSKIDITVQDEDGDHAFNIADGQNLFSNLWAEHEDNFELPAFDPQVGEYIYITIRGYASHDSEYFSPFIGELTINYTAQNPELNLN